MCTHGQPQSVRTIGEELRGRYVLKGNMRRLGATLRVNIRLISAETGALLWSDWFDEEIGEPGGGPDLIVRRVKDELGVRLIDIESARSRSERPTDPDRVPSISSCGCVQSETNLPACRGIARRRRCWSRRSRSIRVPSIPWPTLPTTWPMPLDTWVGRILLTTCSVPASVDAGTLDRSGRAIRSQRLCSVAPFGRPLRRSHRDVPAGHQDASEPNSGMGWASTMSLADARPGWGQAEEGIALETEAGRPNPAEFLGGISATAISAGIACYRAGIRMPSDTSNDPWQSIRRMMATCIGNTAGLRRPMPAQAISQPRGNTSPGPNGFGRMTRCAVVLRTSDEPDLCRAVQAVSRRLASCRPARSHR